MMRVGMMPTSPLPATTQHTARRNSNPWRRCWRGAKPRSCTRWHELQSRFVDDPRVTVERADELVDELMQTIAQQFADSRAELERQWTEGGDASTEDLRLTLQRYRSFFERLLAV